MALTPLSRPLSSHNHRTTPRYANHGHRIGRPAVTMDVAAGQESQPTGSSNASGTATAATAATNDATDANAAADANATDANATDVNATRYMYQRQRYRRCGPS
mmetsp:Transcript_2040/g.4088  ORF Transcript_2040/g.4088 Transcript_2040/m.4088 type:complete len:103 (-) Transcript_2040:99-407(-)